MCEHLGYNRLYRWFAGIPIDSPVWDHSSFTRKRDRLIEHDGVKGLFGDGKQHRGLLRQWKVRGLKKANFIFALCLSATNLLRMAKLILAPPARRDLTG